MQLYLRDRGENISLRLAMEGAQRQVACQADPGHVVPTKGDVQGKDGKY